MNRGDWYCSHCGALVHEGDHFCSSCGHALEAGEESERDEERHDERPPLTIPPVQSGERSGGGMRVGAIIVIAVIGVIIIRALVYSNSTTTTAAGDIAAVQPTTSVQFTVTGNAPSGVDITYGNDTSNYQGVQLPFAKSLALDDAARYYQVNAQVQGGGNITCSVTIGSAQVVGHARGGYNICSAQLNRSFDGSWTR